MKKLILLGIFALSLTVNAGYLEDGNLYYKNQNYDKAEKMYLKAIQKGNAGAMSNLGNVYREQKKYDKAKETYLKAAQKGDIRAMNNLGLLYYDLKDYANAKKYIKKAADLGHEKAQKFYREVLQK